MLVLVLLCSDYGMNHVTGSMLGRSWTAEIGNWFFHGGRVGSEISPQCWRLVLRWKRSSYRRERDKYEAQWRLFFFMSA